MAEYVDMDALEILNFFRNKYYTEGSSTENGIVANAINDVLPSLVNALKTQEPSQFKLE